MKNFFKYVLFLIYLETLLYIKYTHFNKNLMIIKHILLQNNYK
jgi:hypothetical protein